MPRFFARLARRSFIALMLAGSALITLYSLPYLDLDELPAFVIEKLPVRFESLWLWSLRVHVASAALSFPLCLLLLTRWLQRRAAWHRGLGRAAGGLVLVGLVPSGSVLAFDAKGGTVVTVGFLLSAALVGWGMVSGILAARRRDFPAHRRGMRHVVGQMSVAVVSRVMLVGLDLAGMGPELAYLVALWIPVLAIALAAELLDARTSPFVHLVSTSLERMRREASTLSLVPVRSVRHLVARPGR